MIKNHRIVISDPAGGSQKHIIAYLKKHLRLIDSNSTHRDVYSKYVDSNFLHQYQVEWGSKTPLGTTLKVGDVLCYIHLAGVATGDFFFLPNEVEMLNDALIEEGGTIGISHHEYRYDRISHVHMFSFIMWASLVRKMPTFESTYLKGKEIKKFITKHFGYLNKRILEFDKCIKIFT